eukprot:CAMPEP_0116958296 /NCGR_PEP_ID=MMETSP0467-20121206/44545_1 /TAXON_ID=283647 /ORGANISM="Mesodinium pulex, Strain SPMC105" /LENGTH=97 /DNA_ID=CAMNT_0004645335 /DNA_START=154 /DNA_END=444 /DNA_ORIENTATION=-
MDENMLNIAFELDMNRFDKMLKGEGVAKKYLSLVQECLLVNTLSEFNTLAVTYIQNEHLILPMDMMERTLEFLKLEELEGLTNEEYESFFDTINQFN